MAMVNNLDVGPNSRFVPVRLDLHRVIGDRRRHRLLRPCRRVFDRALKLRARRVRHWHPETFGNAHAPRRGRRRGRGARHGGRRRRPHIGRVRSQVCIDAQQARAIARLRVACRRRHQRGANRNWLNQISKHDWLYPFSWVRRRAGTAVVRQPRAEEKLPNPSKNLPLQIPGRFSEGHLF